MSRCCAMCRSEKTLRLSRWIFPPADAVRKAQEPVPRSAAKRSTLAGNGRLRTEILAAVARARVFSFSLEMTPLCALQSRSGNVSICVQGRIVLSIQLRMFDETGLGDFQSSRLGQQPRISRCEEMPQPREPKPRPVTLSAKSGSQRICIW